MLRQATTSLLLIAFLTLLVRAADPKRVVAAKTSQAEYIFMHDSWINPYLAPAFHVTRMPSPICTCGLLLSIRTRLQPCVTR